MNYVITYILIYVYIGIYNTAYSVYIYIYLFIYLFIYLYVLIRCLSHVLLVNILFTVCCMLQNPYPQILSGSSGTEFAEKLWRSGCRAVSHISSNNLGN